MTKVHTRPKSPSAASSTAKAPASSAAVPEEAVIQVATSVPLDTLPEETTDGEETELELDSEELDKGAEEEDEGDPDLSLLETPAQSKKGNAASDDESDTEDEEEEGFLEVFSENCMDCKALIPFKKKAYRECHYSKGNTACPASKVQIVIRIPLETITRNWMRCENEGNYAGIAKLSATLATKPDWYQTRVRDALEEARKKAR